VRRVNGSDEDIVAEVFVVAWRRFLEVPEQTEELPWLYGVARNLVANHLRSVQRSTALTDRLVLEERVAGEGATATSDLEIRVQRVVAQLTDLDREIFRLIHWEGLSHDEVGLSVGLTAKAVERRVARSRTRVRNYLDSLDDFITCAPQRNRNSIINPERTIAS
jgi:RNA polymerase sigma-70 factor (ECF subfamily)